MVAKEDNCPGKSVSIGRITEKTIAIDKIVDAFVININSNPYLPPEYYLRLNLEDGKFERIPAGLDGEWAQEALKQLQEAVLAGR